MMQQKSLNIIKVSTCFFFYHNVGRTTKCIQIERPANVLKIFQYCNFIYIHGHQILWIELIFVIKEKFENNNPINVIYVPMNC